MNTNEVAMTAADLPQAGVAAPAETKVLSVDEMFGLADTAQQGKEFELAPELWVTLSYASANNAAYAAIAERELRPYRAALDNNLMSNKDITPVLAKIFSLAVAHGWRGKAWKDADGNSLPWSRANFEAAMARLPVLFEKVRKIAEDFTNFRNDVGDPETDVKN